jgi:hypothetical protein
MLPDRSKCLFRIVFFCGHAHNHRRHRLPVSTSRVTRHILDELHADLCIIWHCVRQDALLADS